MKFALVIFAFLAICGCTAKPIEELPKGKGGAQSSCQDNCEVVPQKEGSESNGERGAINKTAGFVGGVVVWTVAVPVLLVTYVVGCPFSKGGNSFC